MPVVVYGKGATQTAYVSYNYLDIQDRDVAHPERLGSVSLVWPTSYIDAPFYDTVNHIQYELIAASMDINTVNGNTNTVTLPNAMEASKGSNAIIMNVGAGNFTILTYDGTPLQIATPGVAYWFLLRDISTAAGGWQVLTFAAGVSAASAAALAGHGLYASGDNKLNTWMNVVKTNAVPAITADDSSTLYVWNGTAQNIPLPDIATVPNGFSVSFNNQSPTQGPITLTPSVNTQQIDNSDTWPVGVTETLTLIADKSDPLDPGTFRWWTLGFGLGQDATNFKVINKNIAGGATFFISQTDSENDVINLTGILDQNITVGIYALSRSWVINNNTTVGNFTLIVRITNDGITFSGNSYIIPRGTNQMFYGDVASLTLISYPSSLNSLNGANALYIDSAGKTVFSNQILAPNGSSAAPTYGFSSDPTTGFYYKSSSPALKAVIGSNVVGHFQTDNLVAPTANAIVATSPGNISFQFIATDTFGAISYNLNQCITFTNTGAVFFNKRQETLNLLMPPIPTPGDILYFNGTNWVRFPAPAVGGADTAYLKITKATGVPFWSDT